MFERFRVEYAPLLDAVLAGQMWQHERPAGVDGYFDFAAEWTCAYGHAAGSVYRVGMARRDFRAFLAAWVRGQSPDAARRGISIRHGATSDDRMTHSAWITVTRGAKEVSC
jgi:hypothetical protein